MGIKNISKYVAGFLLLAACRWYIVINSHNAAYMFVKCLKNIS